MESNIYEPEKGRSFESVKKEISNIQKCKNSIYEKFKEFENYSKEEIRELEDFIDKMEKAQKLKKKKEKDEFKKQLDIREENFKKKHKEMKEKNQKFVK